MKDAPLIVILLTLSLGMGLFIGAAMEFFRKD